MSENDPQPVPPKPARQPYVAPEITKVPLRPEEAVLGSCKTAGTSGVGADNCMTAACADLGS